MGVRHPVQRLLDGSGRHVPHLEHQHLPSHLGGVRAAQLPADVAGGAHRHGRHLVAPPHSLGDRPGPPLPHASHRTHQLCCGLWGGGRRPIFSDSQDLETKSKFFTTIIWLVVTQLFLIVVFLLYFLLGFGFYVIPMDYQWTMALIIPFVDGFSTKILGALANKAAGRRDASVETIAGSLISISTSLFMSINLGSIATDVTSYVILGIAFFLNLIDILGVVRKIKGGKPTFEEACFDFQDLTINMVLEILLPIRYCQIVIKT